MHITLLKAPNRIKLTCTRQDGTFTQASLGPGFPHHDLAHFVVESRLKLRGGFWGTIASGRSIQEMSDGAVIRELGPEAMMIEVLVRNLQALGTGNSSPDQYLDLVQWELGESGAMPLPPLSTDLILAMDEQLRQLVAYWGQLGENEKLELEFPDEQE